jgi:GNAT superfamily N-acetyltransferase
MRSAQVAAGRRFDIVTVLPGKEQGIVIRLLTAAKAANERAFVRDRTPESNSGRFQHAITDLTPDMLRRLLDDDGADQIACVATIESGGVEQEVGVARYTVDAADRTAEFAVVVSDGWGERDVGKRLMQELIAHARGRGLRELRGYVRADNDAMLELMRRQGFRLLQDAGEPGVLIASLALREG